MGWEMALEALLQDPLLTVRRQSVFHNVTYYMASSASGQYAANSVF